MPVKLLVVEDEKSILKLLRTILTANKYEVVEASTGAEALSLITSHCPDLILLDLGLPDMDGNTLLSSVRKWTSTPVIVLSARTHESDKVEAIDLGADDYITKPFGLLELTARVRAALRRNPSGGGKGENILTAADITLNVDSHEVFRDGTPLELTLKEFELLKLLILNSNRVVPRENLLGEIWGYDYMGETRTLDMHIKTLRAKLGDDADNPRYIKTVRSVGYKFIAKP